MSQSLAGLSGTSASNYNTLPNITGLISRKALQISGTSVSDKAYDGNRQATIDFGTLLVLLLRNIEVDGGPFDSAQPGNNKSVLVSYVLKNGANGGLSSNYSLTKRFICNYRRAQES